MNVQYLNTDLELESASDLAPIVEAFGEDVVVLRHGIVRGNHRASFEIAGSHAGPNEDIKYFVALVEALPPSARALWNGCYSRVFDIGYRSGSGTPSYRSELRSNTIQALADLNATIVVTVYPVTADDT
jgi:hypothetical protein